MSIGGTLVTYLKAQVSPLASRVYPNKAPDSPTVPYAVVHRVSNVRTVTHDGYAGVSWVRWQISVFDTDYTRARGVADDVVTALEAWHSSEAKVQVSLHAGETELYEADTKRHHIAIDFRVFCEE